MKIIVKGKPWKVHLVDTKKYANKYEITSAAATDLNNKTIWFDRNIITFEIARHEIFHAMVGECNTESANLSAFQMEELAASIIGDELENIEKLSKQIMKNAKRHKQKGRPV